MASKKWRRDEFTLPRVIVCEGRADEAFLRSLIRKRNLPEFNIRNPADRGPDASGGIDQIGALMEGFSIQRGFPEVKDILIVVDSDSDPTANFHRVVRQLQNISSFHFDVPTSSVGRTSGQPTVAIALMPWHDQPGNLESLCVDAALSVDLTAAACVEDFARCIGALSWGKVTQTGKLKLRAVLAAKHRRNPMIPLGNVWNEEEGLIPLEHHSFDRLAAVLGGYRP